MGMHFCATHPWKLFKILPFKMVWYGIVEFNVPLNTVQVISERSLSKINVNSPGARFTNVGPVRYKYGDLITMTSKGRIKD